MRKSSGPHTATCTESGIGQHQPRKPWTRPTLGVADVKDLTRSAAGSGTDRRMRRRMSDRRLKRDIRRCGQTLGGIPLYAFRYVWGGPVYVGTIAQEIIRQRPDAVTRDAIGLYRVEYDALDIELAAIPA